MSNGALVTSWVSWAYLHDFVFRVRLGYISDMLEICLLVNMVLNWLSVIYPSRKNQLSRGYFNKSKPSSISTKYKVAGPGSTSEQKAISDDPVTYQ